MVQPGTYGRQKARYRGDVPTNRKRKRDRGREKAVYAEQGACKPDKDAKLDHIRDCGRRARHRTADGIKRTCMPMHSLYHAPIHAPPLTLPLQRAGGRRSRSTAPGWLISCRAFHVTVSLLSRLCHFAARAHARTQGWQGGKGEGGEEGDGAVPRCKHRQSARSPRVHCPRAQSKLHCNRGCNRRAINQCPDHGCVLPISKSRAPPTTTRLADKTKWIGERSMIWKWRRRRAFFSRYGVSILSVWQTVPSIAIARSVDHIYLTFHISNRND